MTTHISCRRLTKIGLQIPRWRTKWRPWNTTIGYNSVIYSYRDFVLFTEFCVMTSDISCGSLTQIELQIPRWRTKWRPWKGMAIPQAFIFHCKCYSILHFAVCQLLGWAFLLKLISHVTISITGCHRVLNASFDNIAILFDMWLRVVTRNQVNERKFRLGAERMHNGGSSVNERSLINGSLAHLMSASSENIW